MTEICGAEGEAFGQIVRCTKPFGHDNAHECVLKANVLWARDPGRSKSLFGIIIDNPHVGTITTFEQVKQADTSAPLFEKQQ